MKKILLLTLAFLALGCSDDKKDNLTLTKAEQDEINNVLAGEWRYQGSALHIFKFSNTYTFTGSYYEDEAYTISKSTASGRYRINFTRLDNNYHDFQIVTTQSGEILKWWNWGKDEPDIFTRFNP